MQYIHGRHKKNNIKRVEKTSFIRRAFIYLNRALLEQSNVPDNQHLQSHITLISWPLCTINTRLNNAIKFPLYVCPNVFAKIKNILILYTMSFKH